MHKITRKGGTPMKTISINLKCEECGCEFTHTKSVRGNRESYKYWALNHITQCPRCFAKAKKKERLAWTIQYLSDNGIELQNLSGTPKQIKYAEKLREEFIGKYYLEIVDVIHKYNASRNSFNFEAKEKGIQPGQAALQRWKGTRDYYLFASVFINSAGFLIDMFLNNGIEKVA